MNVHAVVADTRDRSRSLLDEGCVRGAMHPALAAAFVAASERVDSMTADELVVIVKEGLQPGVVAGYHEEVRELALQVLLAMTAEETAF